MPLHEALLTVHQLPTDSHLSLCSGMDMEERTRQMKLKMNKYKQGAGSDSRLEQDYHKVKKTHPGLLNLCFNTQENDVPTQTLFTKFQNACSLMFASCADMVTKHIKTKCSWQRLNTKAGKHRAGYSCSSNQLI